MFARQVDPLAEYSSAISAAEQRARQESLDHCHSHDHLFTIQPSAQHTSSNHINSNAGHRRINSRNNIHATSNPNKRKHTFHFEPDFFAALDSSTIDNNEGVNNSGSSSNHNNNNRRSSCSTPLQQGFSPLKRAKRSNLNNAQIPLFKVTVSQQSTPTESLYEPNFPKAADSSQHFTRRRRSSSSSSRAGFSTHMSHKRSNGPSIFDLSSGEELLALHLGNNEHKRMRDCEPMSPTASIDSLGEVFDYQDDVNLLPIRNYLPTQPSPAKKVRLGRSSQHSSLRFLSEEESNAEIQDQGVKLKQSHSQRATTNHGFLRRTKQKRKSCIYRSGSRFMQGSNCSVITNTYDDNETDGAFEYDKEVKASARDHDEKETHNEIDSKAERAVVETGNHELIGYHRPVACSLSDGLAIDWKLWNYLDPSNALLPKKLMGNELVLYKRRSSVEFEINKDGYNGRQERKEGCDKSKIDYQSSVIIEELDDDEDDDGNMADDEACELSDDGPLLELGEKIMDMDLD